MNKTYICTKCKEHCSPVISVDLQYNGGIFSNCCTNDMLGEDGEMLTLPEFIRDVCQEQRELCEEEIYFAKMGDYESLKKKILSAPLVQIERALA